jgi:hypothetical protein
MMMIYKDSYIYICAMYRRDMQSSEPNIDLEKTAREDRGVVSVRLSASDRRPLTVVYY